MNSNCYIVLDLRNLQEQVKKAFCFKNCTDLSLFEKKNVLLISKSFQILDLQHLIWKVYLDHQNNFFSQYSEQFWRQNTIAELHLLLKLTPVKTKTWIFKLVLDPGHGGCFRGRIAICFDFICTVYLMAKCIFQKPLLKSAMIRCLQKIRVKVKIFEFEKATKISQLLFELTILDFYS